MKLEEFEKKQRGTRIRITFPGSTSLGEIFSLFSEDGELIENATNENIDSGITKWLKKENMDRKKHGWSELKQKDLRVEVSEVWI